MVVGLLMIGVCVIAATIAKKLKATKWISGHNFTIYIFSWLFQSVAMVICEHLKFNWFPMFLIMFAIGFMGPVCIIVIYEHVPVLNKKWINLVLGMR